MNATLKRALSGSVYVSIMWFGTFCSEISFHILFAVILLVCLYEMYKLRKGKTKILAFLYVLAPLLLVHFYTQKIILFIFILTWTFDTFAYFVGVKFGKHKIIPTVSPKKSWEGFVGGFIFTVTAAYLTANYFPEVELNHAIAISLFLPLTATIGDFTESYYKRKAGVKDSGNFIPGHGGMLDRIDGVIFAIPATILIIQPLAF